MSERRVTLKGLMQAVNSKLKIRQEELRQIASEEGFLGNAEEIVGYLKENAHCLADEYAEAKLGNLVALLKKRDTETLRLTHAAMFEEISQMPPKDATPTTDDDPAGQEAIDSLLSQTGDSAGIGEEFNFDAPEITENEQMAPLPSQEDVDALFSDTQSADEIIQAFENPPEDKDMDNLLSKLDNNSNPGADMMEKEFDFSAGADFGAEEMPSISANVLAEVKQETEPSFEELIEQAETDEFSEKDVEESDESFDAEKYLAESKITDFITPENMAAADNETKEKKPEPTFDPGQPAKEEFMSEAFETGGVQAAPLGDDAFPPAEETFEEDLATVSDAAKSSNRPEQVKGEKIIGTTYRLYLRSTGGELLLSEADTEKKIKEDYLNLLPNYRARDLMLKRINIKEVVIEREEAEDMPVQIKISF